MKPIQVGFHLLWYHRLRTWSSNPNKIGKRKPTRWEDWVIKTFGNSKVDLNFRMFSLAKMPAMSLRSSAYLPHDVGGHG